MSAEHRHSAQARARVALAVSIAIAGTSLAGTAFAQEEPEDDGVVEVIVTGTRIQSPNATSSSPILAVTSEDVKVGGRTDVSDVLNMLPQINSNSLGQGLGNRTSGLSSAGGVANADLRGLGPNRTLVLVNGRRLGTGSPQSVISSPAPDLDQIPTALIERVDVVTGGASAVYGSDAIAGVVNFITRRNFEGIEFDAQLGGNWHSNGNKFVQQRVLDSGETPLTGTEWDGRTIDLSLTAGTSILDGRGNITGFLGYKDMHPVRSTQRDFGGCQLSYTDDNLDDVFCLGSSNSNFFLPNNPDTNPDGDVFSVAGNQFVPFDTQATMPPAYFNSQPYIYMQRGSRRYNAGFMANVEVSPAFEPYVEFMFMDDRTHQEVAPTALFRQSNVLTEDGNYLINCSNPLLSAQQAALLCTPAQIAADLLAPGTENANVEIGRRNVEGGARTYEYNHTNYRFVVGGRGEFAEGWRYDAYGQYYYTSFSNLNGGDFGFDKIANALQVQNGPNGPECISQVARLAGCVPYNIFADGGVTPEQLAYLETLGTATGSTELGTIHADVTGDLGIYGVQLPTASEGVAINVGYEQRNERIRYTPDAAYESGLIVGTGGAYPRINNSLSVKEYSAEARVPLMQDRPGAYDLVFDTGYRYSDYSSGVSTDTYKFELQYAPVADMRFRASYNRAVRAPTIVELYIPQLVSKIAMGEDPCAPGEISGVATATLEQCIRTGVTPAQYGNGSTTNTIPQGTANQLTQLGGGNPDLEPETADTYTIGVTLTPQALPGLTASIDYFKIELKDQVGTLPANLILSNCLNTGDPVYCDEIVRHPITGTLNGASVVGGGYIRQTNINIGQVDMSGIDLQATYRFDLGDLGRLRLMLNGSYLLNYETTPIPDGGSYDCAGLFGPTCQTVNPKWRHNLRASWDLPRDVSVSATWRFMTGVDLDNNDSNPLLLGSALGAPAVFRKSMSAMSYLDLAASWSVSDHLQLRAGINNVLDRDPPIAPADIISGGAPNYYEFYDGLGRQVFAGVTLRY